MIATLKDAEALVVEMSNLFEQRDKSKVGPFVETRLKADDESEIGVIVNEVRNACQQALKVATTAWPPDTGRVIEALERARKRAGGFPHGER